VMMMTKTFVQKLWNERKWLQDVAATY